LQEPSGTRQNQKTTNDIQCDSHHSPVPESRTAGSTPSSASRSAPTNPVLRQPLPLNPLGQARSLGVRPALAGCAR
jgi:hypothetical protein